MRHSSLGKIVGTILFLIGITGAVSAVMTCDETNSPGSAPILSLSDTFDAHAEIVGGSGGYGTTIYCRETAPGVALSASGANSITLLNLSSNTNAHLQGAGVLPPYTVNINMGLSAGTGTLSVFLLNRTATGEECDDTQDADGDDYATLLYLSAPTNAHGESPVSGQATHYPYAVCFSYNGGAIPPDVDIVSVDTSFILPVIPSAGTTIAPIATHFSQFGNADYDNVRTALIVAICDKDSPTANPICASITNAGNFHGGMSGDGSPTYGNPSIFLHRKAINYGGTTSPPIPVDILNISPDSSLENKAGGQGSMNYVLDPATMGLVSGVTYRLLMMTTYGIYDYDNGTVSATDYPEKVSTQYANNFAVFEFTVSPDICGDGFVTGTEVCDPPGAQGVCSAGFKCNATCDACINAGSATPGAAGDVYILKDILFPNVYTSNTIQATLAIENKDIGLTGNTPSVDITVNIRDSSGGLVAGYDPATYLAVALDFSSSAVDTITLDLQPAGCVGAACPFQLGKTYTLYATVKPYDNVDPAKDEKVTINNSGYKTFTTLEAPQTYAVPDSPWWMSVAVVSLVFGWLFASARKNK